MKLSGLDEENMVLSLDVEIDENLLPDASVKLPEEESLVTLAE